MKSNCQEFQMGKTIAVHASRFELDLNERIYLGTLEEDTTLDSIRFTLSGDVPKEVTFTGKLSGKTGTVFGLESLSSYSIYQRDHGAHNIVNRQNGSLFLKAGTELFIQLEVSKDRDAVNWNHKKFKYSVTVFKVVDTQPKELVKVKEEVDLPYIILTDSISSPLVSSVKEYMEKGYVPQGGPIVVKDEIKQAMTHKDYV